MTTAEPKRSALNTASGHDAPLHYRSEDFYNRWPVASAISRAIDAAPINWSTRIAIYGEWGAGKTSVLNFVATQQKTKGNILIRYSPWGASTESDVWRGFTKAMRQGLKEARIGLGLPANLCYLFRRHIQPLLLFTKAMGKAGDATIPGASVTTDFIADTVGKHVRLTERDVHAMATMLGERRVVVVIDDLDRTDPSLIPKLLLALRDLLDFSRFTFVLAFDRKIVASALRSHNDAWRGNSEDFLGKIIDFPFELPPPNLQQVKSFGEDQFAKLCPFIPRSVISDVASVLPPNPRKMKLLGRMLANGREQADRHEIGEINWNVAVIFTILRLESHDLAEDVLDMSLDYESDDTAWLQSARMPRIERDETRPKAIAALIEKHQLSERATRITALLEAWAGALPYLPGESLRQQTMFAIAPPCMTWKEFHEFFDDWRRDKDPSRISEFINAQSTKADQTPGVATVELEQATISSYERALERASNAKSGEAHLDLIELASDCLDLCRQLFTPAVETTRDSLPENRYWHQLHNIVRQWRHFDANPGEPELRKKETALLFDIAHISRNPLDIFEALSPWRERESVSARAGQLEKELTAELLIAVRERSIESALSYIRVPGEMKRIRAHDSHLAPRYLLTSPQSPLFASEDKRLLMACLDERWGSRHVVEDAVEYLALLLEAIPHGDTICTGQDRRQFFVDHTDFTVGLWRLCVSRPSQFRGLQGLREKWVVLTGAGIDAAALERPDWLKP